MAVIYKDRVMESTTTAGTGTLTLGGALPGCRAFSVCGDGAAVRFVIEQGDAWEISEGVYTLGSTTLTRGTLLRSSTGSKLNLTGDPAIVFLAITEDSLTELGVTHLEDAAARSIAVGPFVPSAIGDDCAAFGAYALYAGGGIRNAAFGALAGYSLTTGSSNVLVGYYAGYNLVGGSGNTIIGRQAGQTITGYNNVLIGQQAGNYLPAATSNYLVIAWGSTAANTWLTGDNNGDLFVTYDLEVAGTLTADGLTYPANEDGDVGQVLGKTADGTIGFVDVSSEVPQHIGHRLSLASADAFPQANQTAKTDLYLLPFRDNLARLYDGSAWQLRTIGSLSFDITTDTDYDSAAIASGSLYDVFIAWNSGTHKLVFKKWTSAGAGSSTRATALVKQDGVDVLSGATDHVFIGTVYVNGSTQLEDSTSNRYVGNLYNAQPRTMAVDAGTVVHSWSGGVRAWNNNTALRMNFVCPEVRQIDIGGIMGTIDSSPAKAGAAIDSTTSAFVLVENRSNTFNRTPFPKAGVLEAGFHYVQLVEDAESSGSGNFYEIKGEVVLNL